MQFSANEPAIYIQRKGRPNLIVTAKFPEFLTLDSETTIILSDDPYFDAVLEKTHIDAFPNLITDALCDTDSTIYQTVPVGVDSLGSTNWLHNEHGIWWEKVKVQTADDRTIAGYIPHLGVRQLQQSGCTVQLFTDNKVTLEKDNVSRVVTRDELGNTKEFMFLVSTNRRVIESSYCGITMLEVARKVASVASALSINGRELTCCAVDLVLDAGELINKMSFTEETLMAVELDAD